MSELRVVLIGLGQIGRLTTKYLIEKDANIVAAVDKFSHEGEDVGSVAGVNDIGIKVQPNLAEALTGTQANVAILSTCSSMDDLIPDAKLCMENGLNVITITEAAFYPWNHSEQVAQELDSIAKNNGVSFLPTGVPDIYYANLVALLAAGSQRIDTLKIEAVANFGKLGPALLDSMPLGLTPEQFGEAMAAAAAPPPPSIPGMMFEAVAKRMQLSITSVTPDMQLITDSVDVVCEVNGRVINPGQISGFREIITMETKEGVQLVADFTAKIFADSDEEYTEVTISGTPNITTRQANLPGFELTCTTVVNRIPDAINAAPGLVTADMLPFPQYRAHPLDTYI